MRLLHRLAIALGCYLLTACTATPVINTDCDIKYSFNNIKTFYLVEKQQEVDSLTADRITGAIKAAMSARGINLTTAQQADIWVDFLVKTRDKNRISSYNRGYGYRCFRCGYPACHDSSEIEIDQYTEGSLIIDLVSPTRPKTIWRTLASARVTRRTPREKTELTNRYTRAIVDEMPLGSPVPRAGI